MVEFDVAIIGAGIAGASLAAEIAPYCRVLIAEAEQYPGYHATGRSAAFWTETYGGPDIQPLTTASGPWLATPPTDFSDRGFLHPRGALTLAKPQDKAKLASFAADFADSTVTMVAYDRADLERHVPGLSPEYQHGIYEPDCCDIDVGGLHQAYLAAAKRAKAVLWTQSRLTDARRKGDVWQLQMGERRASAPVIVNAAGAWADPVAAMAGAAPLGIRPFRRTVLQLRTDPPVAPDLPLTLGINGDFYFKPEGTRLWLSPHDETPDDPGDAAPDEWDVALAIARLQQTVDWRVIAVEQKWAGLRSFAPDRLPVYGWDQGVDGLFWFAGQGGFGIQTAPAAAKIGAALLLERPRDDSISGINTALYDPARFSALRTKFT